MAKKELVRAVAFREGDVWVVHGVEHDLVAQAEDLLDAPRAFLKTVVSTMLINRRRGRPDFHAVKRAPERYLQMYERAEVELTPVRRRAGEPGGPELALRGFRENHPA